MTTVSPRWSAITALALVGCGYVSSTEFGGRVDADGDGVPAQGFTDPGDEYDCDDTNADPSVSEPSVWYLDQDGDGAGDFDRSVVACDVPEDHVADGTDCDDGDARRFVGNTEVCDSIDNDCDTDVDELLPTADYYVDQDSDGFGDKALGLQTSCVGLADRVSNGDDCDDGSAAVNPDADEVCNDVDDDCANGVDDGLVFLDYFADVDGDSFGSAIAGAIRSCLAIDGRTLNDDDCDDANNAVFPNAVETCNGTDDDCAGGIDNGLVRVDYYLDADSDGFGNPTGGVIQACAPLVGRVADYTDCDDTDGTVFPVAPERCDGQVNACGGAPLAGEIDGDGDGHVVCDFSAEVWAGATAVVGSGDCLPNDPNAAPGKVEVCDGVDNDCNSTVDDGITIATWFPDTDGDGYGDPDGVSVDSCASNVLGHALLDSDCDDARATIYPSAIERCDGLDDDCDGALAFRESDDDGDGYVECRLEDAVAGWEGDPSVTPLGDCDDGADQRFPGNNEVCDAVDNDCDGLVDDGLASDLWFPDADSDGYGVVGPDFQLSCAPVAGRAKLTGDCADADAARHPGAIESCDPIDWDCDGDAFDNDSTDAFEYYRDADKDLYGDVLVLVTSCAAFPPSGYTRDDTDCDDTQAKRSPALLEVCDNLDNDCDAVVDDNPITPFTTDQLYYRDADGDTWGDAGKRACTKLSGYEDVALDCRDDDPAINPDATEVADGVDNDCDGGVDGSGMGNSIVIDGDNANAKYHGQDIAKAEGGRFLVSGNGGTRSVFLYDPPFVSGVATAVARTEFRGRAGYELAVRGDSGVDLTGDGVPDYVFVELGGENTALIVPGPAPTGVVDLTATSTGTIRVSGVPGNAIRLAHAVASVTADPYPDLLIATSFEPAVRPSSCSPDTLFGRGSVSVMAGPFTQDTDLDARHAWMNGHHRYASLGYSIAGGGDLNADGTPDIVLGAPSADDEGYGIGAGHSCTAGGRAMVVLGPVEAGEMTPHVTLRGANAEIAGSFVDLRDLDGDGRADVVIGAPYNSRVIGTYGTTAVSKLYVVRGVDLYPSGGTNVLPPSGISGTWPGPSTSVPYFRFLGTRTGTWTGFGKAASIGDVNGDEVPDLLVGAEQAAYLFTSPLLGASTVYFDEAQRYWTHTSALSGTIIVPDLIGGRGEVVLGSPSMNSNVGEVYVFEGEEIFGTP